MTRRESEGKKLTDLVNVGFWEHVKKDNGDIEVTLADGETMTVTVLTVCGISTINTIKDFGLS
jgi:hypothetical protein